MTYWYKLEISLHQFDFIEFRQEIVIFAEVISLEFQGYSLVCTWWFRLAITNVLGGGDRIENSRTGQVRWLIAAKPDNQSSVPWNPHMGENHLPKVVF